MVRNDSQWTQLIICKLDHLWYASGKIKRIFFSLCFSFFFGPGLKISFTHSIRLIFSTSFPQMIQFKYDKLSP